MVASGTVLVYESGHCPTLIKFKEYDSGCCPTLMKSKGLSMRISLCVTPSIANWF